MTICNRCHRPVWDGGVALSSKLCHDVMDGGLSCFLLEMIYWLGNDELKAKAKAALEVF